MSTYDVSKPEGSSDPKLGDDAIRTLADANQEINDVDHYWEKTGNQVTDADKGKHRQVRFAEKQDDSTLDNNTLAVSNGTTKDENELVYQNTDDDPVQITKGGKVNIKEANSLENDTYLTAENEAGDGGTVNLIKAGRNEADDADVAVVPDAIRTATNAAPAENTGIANKKYVDDQRKYYSGDSTPAPLSFDEWKYEGGESVTEPSGRIVKSGYKSCSSGEQTVTFATKFPTGIVSALVTLKGSASHYSQTIIKNYDTEGITVIQPNEGGEEGFTWFAIGY